MAKQIKELKFSEILFNPANFRHDFEGSEFGEMVESVKKKGVIQPILVRPVEGKKPYELVFGARRLHAAKAASKSKNAPKTVPAMIEKLTDDEAYDLMLIENLRRKDLTEAEEAKGFKDYLDKHGESAMLDLAERTGIKASFIRRRISVLKLPQEILEAWQSGDILFGYLEQLARLDDENEIMLLFEDIMDGYEITSIKELKDIIDDQAVELDHARFDLKKEGCLSCSSNSDVQMKMFDIDAGNTKCLNTECFKEKQIAWLDENWKRTKFHKDFKTVGYKFSGETGHGQPSIFHYKKYVSDQCRQCDAFVTVFSGLRLDTLYKRACVGEKRCFDKIFSAARAAERGDQQKSEPVEGQGGQHRVAWHGEFFRERFFQERIPQRFEKISAGELHAVQLALFALVKSKWELINWFMETYAGRTEIAYYDQTEIFKPISEMSLPEANAALKEATLTMMMYDDFRADARLVVAGHIGIDLSKEWVFTREYLQKKYIPEIIGMGERFGIFKDPKAKKYLSDEIGKKSFNACKKGELIDVFLESGVDLTGKVPDEILDND